MIRDPEIAALRDDLEQLGVVVAPHSDHLCVRLPLFASVRVRLDAAGRLKCDPMFGPLPRTRAVLFSTTTLTLLAAGLFYHGGASPLALTAAFLGVMSGIGSAWRFILTESCVTRIQLLWAMRLRERHERPALLKPHPPQALGAAEVPLPDLTASRFEV